MKSLMLIGVDLDAVKEMLNKLEPQQQDKALKKALRMTAEQARQRLADKAQESYTVKDVGFKKEMKIRTSSAGGYSATIRSEGSPLPLIRFKYSKGKRETKVQVVKPGTLKPLRLERGNINAFVNNIAAKDQVRKKTTKKGAKGSAVRHYAIAQRQGKARLHIEEKYGNSIPMMIGSSKRVYGIVQPQIGADLAENLRKFIDEALGRGS